MTSAECCTFSLIFNRCDNPSMEASLIVKRDLSVSAFISHNTVSSDRFNHLPEKGKKLTSCTEISNILAHLQALCEYPVSYDDLIMLEVLADMVESVINS